MCRWRARARARARAIKCIGRTLSSDKSVGFVRAFASSGVVVHHIDTASCFGRRNASRRLAALLSCCTAAVEFRLRELHKSHTLCCSLWLLLLRGIAWRRHLLPLEQEKQGSCRCCASVIPAPRGKANNSKGPFHLLLLRLLLFALALLA